MPESPALQRDSWVDEEISSLLETVEPDANGEGAAMAVRRRRRPRRRLRRPAILGAPRALRNADKLWSVVRPILVYGAGALALGAIIGWLAVRLTP
jgi:hypothetical protein